MENCVCLLRNLSYQVHREVPGSERFMETMALNQGPPPANKGGCFGSRKGKGQCQLSELHLGSWFKNCFKQARCKYTFIFCWKMARCWWVWACWWLRQLLLFFTLYHCFPPFPLLSLSSLLPFSHRSSHPRSLPHSSLLSRWVVFQR